jgi:transposase-like protein
MTQAEAEQHRVAFAEQWDSRYPTISKSWLAHWDPLSTFFVFPDEIRRVIYTTNAIESTNMTLQQVLKITVPSPSMKRHSRSCIWQFTTFPENGRCRFVIGNPR